MVETFLAKLHGNKNISENFKVKEFQCKDGSDIILIDVNFVIDKLQLIRTHFGKPMTINSAHRTDTYNKKIGGATNSYHVKGRAFDIVMQGVSIDDICEYAESIGILGIIKYNTFVHLDSRTQKYYSVNNGKKETVMQTFKKVQVTAKASKFGIDIAKWNIISDYDAVKKDGVEFAILKTINKSNNPDDLFYRHLKGCKSANIPIVGGYNYLYANTVEKAKQSAEAFVRVAENQIPIYWADVEDECMKNLGVNLINIINTIQEVIECNGIKFGIYTGMSFYNSFLKKYETDFNVPMWIARYYAGNDVFIPKQIPNTKYKPTIRNIVGWQYSSHGIVNGIQDAEGNKTFVDMNII